MSSFTFAARAIAITACSGAAVLGSTAYGVADPGDTLMGMLPDGFTSANCQENTKSASSLERVTCDKSSDPSGPSRAVFLRYGSVDDLAAQFKSAGDNGYTVASSCPGGKASPGTWSPGSSNQTGGQVECATNVDGQPAVIWTDNAKLRLAVVEGSDISSLYQWWAHKSG